MDKKIKILVAGDVRGNFKTLFQRVESINKKAGPFDFLLCVGEFFGTKAQNDELIAFKNGNKHICVPAYILGPTTAETAKFYEVANDGEICTNLVYLGRRGLYTTSAGVRIVYLSGVESKKAGGTHCFTKEDVTALINSCLVSKSNASDYKGVDILLTSQWPYGVKESQNENASKLISFLCKEIKPRYHFCGLSDEFYEPAPFRIPSDQITQLELCTRFLSMASVGNAAKAKYIYALSLTPVEKMRVLDLIQKTTNETKCPFLGIDFKDCHVKNENSEQKQYFFDMQTNDDGYNRKRHSGGNKQHDKRPKIMNIEQDKCWFCLASPDVEKHLIISIGEHFYLALAKGPLNEYHVLLIPITHISAAAQLIPEDWEELLKFKAALRAFFKSQNLVVCFTERNYKTAHMQINALAIDEGYSWKIEHTFEDKAEEYKLEFENILNLIAPELLPHKGPYFVAELPNETTLITRQMKHFPLHFARDVFCSENLLNCDEKIDWKDCKLERDEEIRLVQNFREKFKQFDFTLE